MVLRVTYVSLLIGIESETHVFWKSTRINSSEISIRCFYFICRMLLNMFNTMCTL